MRKHKQAVSRKLAFGAKQNWFNAAFEAVAGKDLVQKYTLVG